MNVNAISSINFQGKKLSKAEKAERKAERKANRKQTGKAFLASNGVQVATAPITLALAKKMCNYSKTLTPEQIAQTNAGIDQVLNSVSELGKKGVKIIDFKEKLTNPTKLPDRIYGAFDSLFATANGDNAFFSNTDKMKNFGIDKNSVVINREKLPLAAFHELGHAHNFNASKIMRALQNVRMPAIAIASVLALIPALTKEEVAKEGEELTKAQKFKNKFRKACPALAGLSMMPIVAEEAVATIKGNGWAKQVLTKDLAKKVAKANGVALCTYVITAAAMALGGYVALKVKDAKNKKQNNQSQIYATHQG